MKIAIEAQRIFRTNKHGMDFVALETIRELQKLIIFMNITYWLPPEKIIVWKNQPTSIL